MKFQIHKTYLLTAIAILIIEIGIAVFLNDGFIRHTFGDFLVVILIYCTIRAFVETNPILIALIVLLFSFGVEFSQLFNFIDYLGLREHKLAIVILGSTFQISDLIAYTLGTMMISVIDLKTTKWEP